MAFGGGGAAVGYGVVGTDVVAAEAQGTVVAPGRSPLVHDDILQGAGAGTFAAAHAGVGGVERLGRHGVALEPGVDPFGFDPCPTAAGDLRFHQSALDVSGDSLHTLGGGLEFLARQFRRVDVESLHQGVGVGHDHGVGAHGCPASAGDEPSPYLVGQA